MTNKLENIGFYTLSDERARATSSSSPLMRCELLVTEACNFKCPYCRGLKDLKGHMPFDKAMATVNLWIEQGLQNVRFSGGEPTLYPYLNDLVRRCRDAKVNHIAISSNGSADRKVYERLLEDGANDFSISLDACCSSFADKMAGRECGFIRLTDNIRFLSSRVYTTVGVVLTEDNISEVPAIIKFADSLGVHYIRVIPAAQFGMFLPSSVMLGMDKHRILAYRANNLNNGRGVRGLGAEDTGRCSLVLDDMAVVGDFHYPCIIYLREGGAPIGKVGPNMRGERAEWSQSHDCHDDPICRGNCLDVCVDYNNKVMELQP